MKILKDFADFVMSLSKIHLGSIYQTKWRNSNRLGSNPQPFSLKTCALILSDIREVSGYLPV